MLLNSKEALLLDGRHNASEIEKLKEERLKHIKEIEMLKTENEKLKRQITKLEQEKTKLINEHEKEINAERNKFITERN